MGSNKVCSQLNFIYCTYFEQGVPWHSGNYRVQTDSKTRMWHDKNTQLNQDCLIQSCILGNTISNKKILILSCIVLGQFSTLLMKESHNTFNLKILPSLCNLKFWGFALQIIFLRLIFWSGIYYSLSFNDN